MDRLPKSLVFVDVETSGGSALRDRIIEIGIVRMEDGEVVEEFSSLVNPQTSLPPFIVNLTGITDQAVASAPTFRVLSSEIERLLQGAVFVAHNARFDYGFVKNEFRRLEQTFNARTLCTVKLLRELEPDLPKRNLDMVMNYFAIKNGDRHRALGDAKVLVELYGKLRQTKEEVLMVGAINKILRTPTLPIYIRKQDLEVVPESPGVYLFYGEDDCLLYVGKSVNLQERVRSHFSSDYANSTDHKISQNIRRIESIPTAGEMSALLLESELVKQKQPLYNRRLRHAREVVVASKRMKDNYLQVEVHTINEHETMELQDILAVFRSQKQAVDRLRNLAEEYTLCPKKLSLESGAGECFHYHLKRCQGACIQGESPAVYNLRVLEAFKNTRVKKWPFEGAVMVKEEFEGLEMGHVVDNWCYLGRVENDDGLQQVANNPKRFDVDVYKILRRFLLSKKQNLRLIKLNSIY